MKVRSALVLVHSTHVHYVLLANTYSTQVYTYLWSAAHGEAKAQKGLNVSCVPTEALKFVHIHT